MFNTSIVLDIFDNRNPINSSYFYVETYSSLLINKCNFWNNPIPTMYQIRDDLIYCLMNTIVNISDVKFSLDANIASLIRIDDQCIVFIERTKFKENSAENILNVKESKIYLKDIFFMINRRTDVYILIINSMLSIFNTIFKEENKPAIVIKSLNSSVTLKIVTFSFTGTYFNGSLSQDVLKAKISIRSRSSFKAEKLNFQSSKTNTIFGQIYVVESQNVSIKNSIFFMNRGWKSFGGVITFDTVNFITLDNNLF